MQRRSFFVGVTAAIASAVGSVRFAFAGRRRRCKCSDVCTCQPQCIPVCPPNCSTPMHTTAGDRRTIGGLMTLVLELRDQLAMLKPNDTVASIQPTLKGLFDAIGIPDSKSGLVPEGPNKKAEVSGYPEGVKTIPFFSGRKYDNQSAVKAGSELASLQEFLARVQSPGQ